MSAKGKAVGAVVVTYHPDAAMLARLFQSLAEQVDWVVVVDNGSGEDVLAWIRAYPASGQFELLALGENQGIAAAQNAGIVRLRERGAKYVVLFDHDSEPAPAMIASLLAVAEEKSREGARVAVAAPRYKSSEDETVSGFVRLGLLRFRRIACDAPHRVVDIDFAIASGSLIPMATLDAIGAMDESLFIDHVDTEWCFRARSRGYRLYGVCDALMIHHLGERRKRIWFLRYRNVPCHSPFRYYYIFRNSLRLQRRPYMPLRWKTAEVVRCLQLFIYFGFFSSDRVANLTMMVSGFLAGLRNDTGKMP